MYLFLVVLAVLAALLVVLASTNPVGALFWVAIIGAGAWSLRERPAGE